MTSSRSRRRFKQGVSDASSIQAAHPSHHSVHLAQAAAAAVSHRRYI